MSDQPPHIEFESVGKTYRDATVLEDVDVAIPPGEFHCLAGPNGAGKSTLFRLAAGLTRPTRGRVIRRAERVGCGFQHPNFYPDLTVSENLDVFAGFADADVDDAWIETLAAALGLDRVSHRRGDELSAGFATALDLGLALLGRPTAVLLDEPLAELDGASRDRVVDVLDAYRSGELAPNSASDSGSNRDSDAGRDDRTVVVATHNVGAFESVATRVTLLADGEVVFDGPYDDLRRELAIPGDGTADAGTLQSRYVELVKDQWGYRDRY
jgi:ABC-2 type transport system ATP-binding protein